MAAKSEGLFSNAPKGKKGKKKTSPWLWAGGIGAVIVAYYFYHKYWSGSTGTAAANALPATQIDPLTGQPYAAGVGSLAPGASGSSSSSSGIDPATGQPYATELATANATNTANTSLISTLENFITGNNGGGGGGGGGAGGGGGSTTTTTTTVPNANAILDAWRTSKAAVIAKAEHISQAQAGQAISQYLQGKPITNAAAARGISNVVANSGSAPTANGAALKVRVAKAKAQPVSRPNPRTGTTAATMHHG